MSKAIGLRTSRAGANERCPGPTPGQGSPSDGLGRVLKELQQAKLTDQSTQRMAELLVCFTIFAEKGLRLRQVRQVSPEHARAFVFAAITTTAGTQRPSVATMHLRRSALRLYFRTLRQLGLFEGLKGASTGSWL